MKLAISLLAVCFFVSCSNPNQKSGEFLESPEDEPGEKQLIEGDLPDNPSFVDSPFVNTQTTKASDSLLVTFDHYHILKEMPVMLLFHQAGWSRGEYKSTADSLYRLGFNVLAADLRSGNEVKGVVNQTAKRAREQDLATTYLEAEKDMLAVLNFAREYYPQSAIHLTGSSYSAGLALKIATEHQGIASVSAFSPGEYYGDELKLAELIDELRVPVFFVSSKAEVEEVNKLMEVVESRKKIHFIPSNDGYHGSRALWPEHEGSFALWKAYKGFLGR